MNGWDESAAAWIESMGENGDRGRRFILDRCMRERIEARGFVRALDVRCGEGRFCRMMQGWGVKTTGIDPTRALLDRARALDPSGRYDEGCGEALPYADDSFDLVVSCLTLIDVPDYRGAISEMSRVLAPGGTLLVANLSSMVTTTGPRWVKDGDGRKMHFGVDNYLAHTESWEAWAGIRIKNYHRPLSAYLQAFLENELRLMHFDEPVPEGADPLWTEKQRRLPWFVVMEWRRA